ncbi:MAG: acetylglutamate kinase [Actinomycetota bacterium]|nr:acetylglutamate kinase [Actinomycetota bacterium]
MSAVVEASAKARTLVEALPYIRSYRNRVVVVKLGGEPLDDAALAARVSEDVALLALVGLRVVVVHGGGPQITRAMQQRGIEPLFANGLRITDDASMELVQHTLIGGVNADLVRRLNAAGAPAVGLSGIDASCIVATRSLGSNGEDLGRVGNVLEVRPAAILALLEQGMTPVVAPVGVSAPECVSQVRPRPPLGETLNVNADAAAAAVAGSLRAEKLVYLTNVEGLYRDLGNRGSLISEMKRDDLAALAPRLSAGMAPKAASALAALDAGVGKVHILDGRVEHSLLLEIFTEDGIGTQVLP